LTDFIEKWIRPEIKALSSYKTQDATGLIKLDAMENPYSLPNNLKEEWLSLLQDVEVNRYPDSGALSLKNQLKEALKIPKGMGVILGNGSDEIIQIITTGLAGNGRCVMSIDPSFVMYRMTAIYSGMNYIGVPLNERDFSLNIDHMISMMKKHNPAIIFLANPNNPTGNLFPNDQIIQIIESAEGIVVIDEAYGPFHKTSFLQKLESYDNLLIMGTVSKMGLAGIRLGFLAGSKKWVGEFDKIRLPYNINSLSQISANFALKHKEVFDKQASMICSERERLIEELKNLSGLKVYESNANFVLIRTPEGKANSWFEQLKVSGILVKNLHHANGLLEDCLRITIGTEHENNMLMTSLKKISEI
tara:strand:+ start:13915 stop:14997 length:1083 start_codon:yes stop_codon:yes gene_type:complete